MRRLQEAEERAAAAEARLAEIEDQLSYWPVRKLVVLHLQSESIRGVLWEIDAHHAVLRSAELLGETGSQIDGEVLVERDRVIWVQVLP